MKTAPKKKDDYINGLLAEKPRRADFLTEAEFDKAYFCWLSREGRIIALWRKQNYGRKPEDIPADEDRCRECGIELGISNTADDFPRIVCRNPSCISERILEAELLDC